MLLLHYVSSSGDVCWCSQTAFMCITSIFYIGGRAFFTPWLSFRSAWHLVLSANQNSMFRTKLVLVNMPRNWSMSKKQTRSLSWKSLEYWLLMSVVKPEQQHVVQLKHLWKTMTKHKNISSEMGLISIHRQDLLHYLETKRNILSGTKQWHKHIKLHDKKQIFKDRWTEKGWYSQTQTLIKIDRPKTNHRWTDTVHQYSQRNITINWALPWKKNQQFVIFSKVTDSTTCPENNSVSEVDSRALQ